jgi:peptidoglycan/xylan/chitin deacetylase (PgdA/CDA1 family)
MFTKSIFLTNLIATLVVSHPHGGLDKRVTTGTIYTGCTVPGVVAISFDDGPYIYTDSILDQLKAAGQSATFFVNGKNWGSIYDYGPTLQRMVNEGHQIGSHTWSHADLQTLSTDAIKSQMTQVETALTSLMGYFPRYMRPPYLSINNTVTKILSQ